MPDDKEECIDTLEAKRRRCAWTSAWKTGYQCPESVGAGGRLCILHDHNQLKDRARFDRRVSEKVVKGDGDFRGVFFPDGMRFRGLLQAAVFAEAVFQGAVSFQAVTFEGHSDFSFAKLQLADFVMARFCEEVEFRYARFAGDATFSGVSFAGGADFSQVDISGEAWFGGAVFLRSSRFNGGIFRGTVGFRSRFEETSSFDDAIFLHHVSFDEMRCLGECSFRRSVFSVEGFDEMLPSNDHSAVLTATFRRVRFSADVYFEGISIGGGLILERAQFDSTVFFLGPFRSAPCLQHGQREILTREAILDAVGPAREIFISPRIVFENALLGGSATIHFENMDLGRTTFAGTNMRAVQFHNVIWPRMLWGKRLSIPQDFRLHGEGYWWWVWQHFKMFLSTNTVADQFSNPGSEQSRRVCRDLKASLDDQRDFADAGDFYYAEMQSRRHQLGRVKRKAYAVYWLTCGYGEKPFRAVVVFVFMWLLLAFGLRGTSFTVSQKVYSRRVEYTSGQAFAPSVEEALDYAARSLVLQQRSSYLDPFTLGAVRLTLAANLLGPTQLALFLLAMRRRFRR